MANISLALIVRLLVCINVVSADLPRATFKLEGLFNVKTLILFNASSAVMKDKSKNNNQSAVADYCDRERYRKQLWKENNKNVAFYGVATCKF